MVHAHPLFIRTQRVVSLTCIPPIPIPTNPTRITTSPPNTTTPNAQTLWISTKPPRPPLLRRIRPRREAPKTKRVRYEWRGRCSCWDGDGRGNIVLEKVSSIVGELVVGRGVSVRFMIIVGGDEGTRDVHCVDDEVQRHSACVYDVKNENEGTGQGIEGKDETCQVRTGVGCKLSWR
jgi:hypothetical protein